MMPAIITRLTITSALISLLALYGCSSGGDSGPSAPTYGGSGSPAIITDANSQELSTTATEASSEAIEGNGINPFAVSITSNSANYAALVTGIAKNVADNLQSGDENLPVGLLLDAGDLELFLPGYCGGTITVPDNFGQDGTLNGTMTFNAVCIEEGGVRITMNGSIQLTQNSTGFSIQFINFTVSDGTDTETLNATLTCDSMFSSCSISAVYVGADGKTYKIENLAVIDNLNGTYNISGRFFNPDYGYVDMTTATGISYNCPTDGRPDMGVLVLTGSNGTITVTFNDCASYTVDFSGGATITYNW